MKLIAPIEKAEDIVNKQYVDNKVSTKVENTETGISTALDKISNNTSNAQELMFMARKRLCGMASKNAQKIMRMIRDEVLKTNPEFEDVLVPNCQYLHSCPEFKSCGRWKEEK